MTRFYIRAGFQRFIGIGLKRNFLAAAQAFIGRYDDVRIAICNAVAQTVGREAGENHGMYRADAGACEHRVGGFGDHRQIDSDAVAFFDATGLQHIGKAADIFVQFAVGNRALLGRAIAFPDDRGLFRRAHRQMAVDTIGAGVQNVHLRTSRIRTSPSKLVFFTFV